MKNINLFIFFSILKLFLIFCQPEDDHNNELGSRIWQLHMEIGQLRNKKDNITRSNIDQETEIQIYNLYIYALLGATIFLLVIILLVIFYEIVEKIKKKKLKNKALLIKSKRTNKLKKSRQSKKEKNLKKSKISQKSENENEKNLENGIKNNIIEDIKNQEKEFNKPNINDSINSERSGFEAPCVAGVDNNANWTNDGRNVGINVSLDTNPYK